MKRLHLHVSVEDLSQSIRFYETLFGAAPSVLQSDYAKWMLEDPRVNFAISQRGGARFGVDHVGVQTDTSEELAELSTRLKAAGATTFDEAGANCCYARSDKTWVADPSGLKWETFHTLGEITTYGEDVGPDLGMNAASACCSAPVAEQAPATSCGCAAA